MTAAQLRDLLKAAGCPTQPAEIGVSMEQLKASYTLARTMRATCRDSTCSAPSV